MNTATVIAEVDSVVAYIDTQPDENRGKFYQHFMPVVMNELYKRNKKLEESIAKEELAIKKLFAREQMVLLGNLAAGIAHELNNAIAVIKSDVKWLIDYHSERFKEQPDFNSNFFQAGLDKGHHLPSMEVRKRSKELSNNFSFSPKIAKKVAQTGIPDNEFAKYISGKNKEKDNKFIDSLIQSWELGATFHDMKIASDQSAHVVQSVKTLGAKHIETKAGQDVNETISSALALIHNITKRVELILNVGEIPLITANKGELIQLWTNIVKNACESLVNNNTSEPTIRIKSYLQKEVREAEEVNVKDKDSKVSKDGERVIVTIEDNGPGIPKNIISNIFKPDVTTKVSGLSFGLGLGLTICEKIVRYHDGTITVKSKPGKTVFQVSLPVG